MEVIPTTSVANLPIGYEVIIKLKREGIRTVEELMSLTDFELSQISGLESRDIESIHRNLECVHYFCSVSVNDGQVDHEVYSPRFTIEQLGLSDRKEKVLRENGILTAADLLKYSYKDLKTINCLGEFTARKIDSAVNGYHYGLSRTDFLPHPEYTPSGKDKLNPDGILLPYSEPLLPGVAPSPDRFYIIAKEEYTIKTFGAFPGSIVVFDQTLPFRKGTLSCFQTAEGLICFDGRDREESLKHLGRAIAILNYYPGINKDTVKKDII